MYLDASLILISVAKSKHKSTFLTFKLALVLVSFFQVRFEVTVFASLTLIIIVHIICS